jgi:recombination protein RecA
MAKKKPSTKSVAQIEADQSGEHISFDDMLADLEKKFGDSIQWGGASLMVATDSTPTGLASLDIALGCRGIPKGRIIEIYGGESSGKTTLALQIVASFQQHDKLVAYVDAEHALDYDWSTHIGVDVSKWLLSQPDSGEQALDIVQALVSTGIVGLVVVDSVAALVPQEELDGDIGDKQIGAQARLMSKGLRKIVGLCVRSGTTVIFINQLRDKIGQVGPAYIHPEVTPGGRALKFYSSIRLEVRRAETLRESDRPYGVAVKIKVAKNKVAPPFRSTSLEILFGSKGHLHGFNKIQALINGAIELSVITLRGSNYYFNDQKIAVGKQKLEEILTTDADLFKKIHDETYKLMESTQVVGSSTKDIEEESSFDEEEYWQLHRCIIWVARYT